MEILEELQKIASSPKATDDIKKLMIKKLARVSPCCVCGGIPSLEVVYDAEGLQRMNVIVNLVRIGYSLEMRYSKHNFKRKVLGQRHVYDQNYHLIRMTGYGDKDVRTLVSRCDLCNDRLPQTEDNVSNNIKLV